MYKIRQKETQTVLNTSVIPDPLGLWPRWNYLSGRTKIISLHHKHGYRNNWIAQYIQFHLYFI